MCCVNCQCTLGHMSTLLLTFVGLFDVYFLMQWYFPCLLIFMNKYKAPTSASSLYTVYIWTRFYIFETKFILSFFWLYIPVEIHPFVQYILVWKECAGKTRSSVQTNIRLSFATICGSGCDDFKFLRVLHTLWMVHSPISG